jgi:hypothetical protein
LSLTKCCCLQLPPGCCKTCGAHFAAGAGATVTWFAAVLVQRRRQAPVIVATVAEAGGPGVGRTPVHPSVSIIAAGHCVVGVRQPGYLEHIVVNQPATTVKQWGVSRGYRQCQHPGQREIPSGHWVSACRLVSRCAVEPCLALVALIWIAKIWLHGGYIEADI